MLWGRHASIGHGHVGRSRQECMCATWEDGQTLLSPAQNTQNVQRIDVTVAGQACVMVTWSLLLLLSLLLLMKQTHSQTGGCAGRHTRWHVVTGRRVDRRSSKAVGRQGATQVDGQTVKMQVGSQGGKRVRVRVRGFSSSISHVIYPRVLWHKTKVDGFIVEG
ncbi:hypothetical protein BC827DRAFT_1159056 [Russula dissimulans]|nr:hypothetical protein BC827DRAFT_1159056 [Russula dissimulans]